MEKIDTKLPVVGQNEIEVAISAAISRIKTVAPSKTLIDTISDADWLANDMDGWKIEAGDGLGSQDELDSLDEPLADSQVA